MADVHDRAEDFDGEVVVLAEILFDNVPEEEQQRIERLVLR